MGREIRRVPPNWRHPKNDNGNYIPMVDKTWEAAIEKWIDGYRQWQDGTHRELIGHPDRQQEKYTDWYGDPPQPDSYRPAFSEEPTWYQMYETVSEGTPCTPPFETKEELRDYLIKFGEFYDQEKGRGGWNPEAAQRFINDEWQPSMMFSPATGLVMGRDIVEKEK